MNEPVEPKPRREKYEKPSVEVVELTTEEALLGVCFVENGGCQAPFSTSTP